MHSTLKIKSLSGTYSVDFCTSVDDTIQKVLHCDVVVIDSKVYDLYKDHFQDIKDVILVECKESNKTLEGASTIIRAFAERKLKSNAHVAVIGGGILQDVAGFACSVYCRGIKYTLIPTTLLSQCDSCIGGKTSINFESVKNILGTFYPPESIYICPAFTKTLSVADYLSGMGEVVKFKLLQNNLHGISSSINDLIYNSLQYKIGIIEMDEFDKKERKFLNFGHTFGHALEITSNYKIPHGTAVLLGILIANRVSTELGHLTEAVELGIYDYIFNYIKHQELQENWFDSNKLLDIVKLDKKNTGIIQMVLLTDQTPIINPISDINILKKVIKEVYEIIRLRHTIS
jgi:3-dehydroquinate synthase